MANEDLDEAINTHGTILDEPSSQEINWSLAPRKYMEIIYKMRNSGQELGRIPGIEISIGIMTGLNDAFVISESLLNRIRKINPHSIPLIKPIIVGADVRRYSLDFSDKYILIIPRGWTNNQCGSQDPWQWMKQNHPEVSTHLSQFEEPARLRTKTYQGDYWWEIQKEKKQLGIFESPKILYPRISDGRRFTLDTTPLYALDTLYCINNSDLSLLGILNSSPMWFYLKHHLSALGDSDTGGSLELNKVFMKRIPIPPAAPDDHRQTIERCVKEALVLAPQEAAALRGSHEQQQLRRRLDQLDAEIDQAVCALYGLTEAQKERVLGVTN